MYIASDLRYIDIFTDGGDPLRLLYKLSEVEQVLDERFLRISGIEPLCFVCLKDAQGKQKTSDFRPRLVEISGIEPLTS